MLDGKLHIFQFATNPVCARYRLDIPAKHLVASGSFEVTTFYRLNRDILAGIVAFADLLILQRLPSSPGVARLIKSMQALGRPVIFEIDDDIFSLNDDSYHLDQAPPDYKFRLRQAALLCQAIQCSTGALAERLRQWHPEVRVLGNQLDDDDVASPRRRRRGPVRIGYAAGENHSEDWQMVQSACNSALQILEAEGVEFEFCVMGDPAIFDSLRTQKKSFLPVLPYSSYLETIAEFDISLMPLADTPFNHAKSDVKFLESAARHAAVLASNVVYGESVKHGRTGMLFQTGDEFLKNLLELARSPQLRRALATQASREIKQTRLMSQHVSRWGETYFDWWLRRGELLRNEDLS